mgnify:CR=1 FL=1
MPERDEPPEGGPNRPEDGAALDLLCAASAVSVAALIWLFILA